MVVIHSKSASILSFLKNFDESAPQFTNFLMDINLLKVQGSQSAGPVNWPFISWHNSSVFELTPRWCGKMNHLKSVPGWWFIPKIELVTVWISMARNWFMFAMSLMMQQSKFKTCKYIYISLYINKWYQLTESPDLPITQKKKKTRTKWGPHVYGRYHVNGVRI